jgi:hypothetical protein
MTFLFLIMVSGCGFGAPAALLVTRGVSGQMFIAAAVVGAAAGPAPEIATIYPTALFSAPPPALLSEEVEKAYADPGS